MRPNNPRLFVYPSDIVRMTGKSLRSARRIIKEIRKTKESECKYISIEDFSKYTGVPPEIVKKALS